MDSQCNSVAVAVTKPVLALSGVMDIHRLSTADELADLVHQCRRRRSETTLVALHLVVSPTVSGLSSWTSIPIIELLRGYVLTNQRVIRDVFLYRLASGEIRDEDFEVVKGEVLSSSLIYRDLPGPRYMDLNGHHHEFHRWLSPVLVEMHVGEPY
jgi:hypothetical protein